MVSEGKGESLTIAGQRLPDLVRLVEDQLLATKFPLQLTRPTVRSILAALPPKVKRRAIDDPDRWARWSPRRSGTSPSKRWSNTSATSLT